ncbi:hypothetical protein DSECCO2_521790 [anaerobic digester metagenome]
MGIAVSHYYVPVLNSPCSNFSNSSKSFICPLDKEVGVIDDLLPGVLYIIRRISGRELYGVREGYGCRACADKVIGDFRDPGCKFLNRSSLEPCSIVPDCFSCSFCNPACTPDFHCPDLFCGFLNFFHNIRDSQRLIYSYLSALLLSLKDRRRTKTGIDLVILSLFFLIYPCSKQKGLLPI